MLRNATITVPYFHNSKLKTLKEVVAFYVRHTSENLSTARLGKRQL